MKGNKGFTLVELLAVLVILAIIALITTPIILGVIEDSRQSGAEDKAWGVVDAIKMAYTEDQTDNNPQYVTGNFSENSTIHFGSDPMVGGKKVRASGQMPTSGTATITNDGTIIVRDLVFDQYHCSSNDKSTIMLCKKNSAPTSTELANGKLN